MMSTRLSVVRLLISSRARAISAFTVSERLVFVGLVTIAGTGVFVSLASTYAACGSVSAERGLAKMSNTEQYADYYKCYYEYESNYIRVFVHLSESVRLCAKYIELRTLMQMRWV